MIPYTDNPKDATRKLLELINEFGKVVGYNINAQKSLAFLHTNNERSEREIKETIPFTATKRIKYLGINLPKEVKDLYAGNYRTLKKEIKDDTNRWRDKPCSRIGRISTVKTTILPKAIYRFNAIPIKLPMAFFIELEQKILKFVWRHKRPRIAKAVLREKTELEESDSLTSDYTTKLQKSRQYGTGTKTRNVDKWNRIESPEINPCTYGQLIYDKGGKDIQWRKDNLFNKWC